MLGCCPSEDPDRIPSQLCRSTHIYHHVSPIIISLSCQSFHHFWSCNSCECWPSHTLMFFLLPNPSLYHCWSCKSFECWKSHISSCCKCPIHTLTSGNFRALMIGYLVISLTTKWLILWFLARSRLPVPTITHSIVFLMTQSITFSRREDGRLARSRFGLVPGLYQFIKPDFLFQVHYLDTGCLLEFCKWPLKCIFVIMTEISFECNKIVPHKWPEYDRILLKSWLT